MDVEGTPGRLPLASEVPMKGDLIETDQLTVWRFEAFITGSTIEPLGPLGQIEVDAATGQILSTSQTAEAMIHRGRQLVPAS